MSETLARQQNRKLSARNVVPKQMRSPFGKEREAAKG
jgi:hypothetical protein